MSVAEHTAAYREYAALLTYWWGVHAYAAEREEACRQRRRAERMPVAFPDDVWDRVPVRMWNHATGHWGRSTWMRARS